MCTQAEILYSVLVWINVLHALTVIEPLINLLLLWRNSVQHATDKHRAQTGKGDRCLPWPGTCLYYDYMYIMSFAPPCDIPTAPRPWRLSYNHAVIL